MKGDASCHVTNPVYREGWERIFGTKYTFVPYPEDQPARYNGGTRCDMLIGPCACGAWHRAET